MDRLRILLAATLFSFFISCGDDAIDIPDEPLGGQVNGNEWIYKFGNAYISSPQDFTYTLRFLSTLESGDDPCPVISSTNPILRINVPLRTGSYSLPRPEFDDNLKFVIGDGTQLSATSGFLEIIAIDNARISGYLQALFDDDNTVQGTFILEICS